MGTGWLRGRFSHYQYFIYTLQTPGGSTQSLILKIIQWYLMGKGEIRCWFKIHKKNGGILFKTCTRTNTDNKHFHYAFLLSVYIRVLSLDQIGSHPQTTNVWTLNKVFSCCCEGALPHIENISCPLHKPSQRLGEEMAAPRGNVANDNIVCSVWIAWEGLKWCFIVARYPWETLLL